MLGAISKLVEIFCQVNSEMSGFCASCGRSLRVLSGEEIISQFCCSRAYALTFQAFKELLENVVLHPRSLNWEVYVRYSSSFISDLFHKWTFLLI